MQTILRYEVPLERRERGIFPYSDKVIRVEHIGYTAGVEVWVYRSHPLTNQNDDELRRLAITATGEAVPDSWVYLGITARHPETGVVWTLWETHY